MSQNFWNVQHTQKFELKFCRNFEQGCEISNVVIQIFEVFAKRFLNI